MTTLRCRVGVIGDAKVGKSALVQAFESGSSQSFPKNYAITTGCDLTVKPIRIPETKHSVELYIMDCGGHPVYAQLHDSYWRGLNYVMVVYDITSRESFANAEKWISSVNKSLSAQGVSMHNRGLLIATKHDLNEFAVVSRDEGTQLAHNSGMAFFEVSALDYQDVDQPFNFVAKTYFELYEDTIAQMEEMM